MSRKSWYKVAMVALAVAEYGGVTGVLLENMLKRLSAPELQLAVSEV